MMGPIFSGVENGEFGLLRWKITKKNFSDDAVKGPPFTENESKERS
jgi:hypothetical protein